MKVRYPKLDFSDVQAHWAPHLEFAHRINGSGLIPAYFEPYLVKVMLEAKPFIDPANKKLHQEVAVFCKQEAQHCKQHLAFNERIRAQGYDGVAAMEKQEADRLERIRTSRSLKYNLAYADGFEALGGAVVNLWFGGFEEYLEGADAATVELWKWHMAEEHEHRSVAFDVYHELFGRQSLWNSWIYRSWVFLSVVKDLGRFRNRAGAYLLEQDRKPMTPDERAASLAREEVIRKKYARETLLELLKVLSPFYNPARRGAPEGVDEYLKRYEAPAAAGPGPPR